jgi:prevent-host-death family protein
MTSQFVTWEYPHMGHWSVQNAKARFSELLETCLTDGPQTVTKRGAETAVLVPIAEWRRLQHAASPTLKDLLLAPDSRFDLTLPRRGTLRRRAPTPAD